MLISLRGKCCMTVQCLAASLWTPAEAYKSLVYTRKALAFFPQTHIVALLIQLVADRVLGSSGTGGQGSIRVFGDLLIGGRGSLGGGAMDGLRDVVGCVPRLEALAPTVTDNSGWGRR